jgi:5-methyltetrahydropteroyltriglutamate--homocysteine methyltransferase
MSDQISSNELDTGTAGTTQATPDRAFRADQVGSLLRPPELMEARAAAATGTIDEAAFLRQEDEAVIAALEQQRRIGLDVFVDGEFRRRGFMTGFVDNVEGFEFTPAARVAWKGGNEPDTVSPNHQITAVAKLRGTGRIAEREARFLREHAPGPFKITLPSPVNFAFISWQQELSAGVYPTPTEFLADAAAILAAEVSALGDDGLPYLQLDAPSYTHWADPSLRDHYAAAGFHLGPFLGDAIAADNALLDAAGPEVVTGVHLCRGNSIGRWMAEGGYDDVAEQLFNELRCDRLLLEYDSPRAGGFAPLRFVPADKVVVLGLLTTKTGGLESRDEILRRIEEAARVVPIERLALSPQCGFASSGEGNPLTEAEQWAKLELVADIAGAVWG